MSLKRTFQLNLVWACLMAAAFLLLFLGAPSNPRALLLLVSCGFVVASIVALSAHRWAVLIVVLVAVAILLRWLPMVLVNAWMFATDHPMYVDSPGTIMVVAVYAIVFAVPASVVVALYVWYWRSLWSVVRLRSGEAG